MRWDEELDHHRQENIALRHALQKKDEELDQALKANQDLREGLKEAISAIKRQQEQVKDLEEVITSKPGAHQNARRAGGER